MTTSHWPVERGFRRRGLQVTHLETFVDATFAFSPSPTLPIDPVIGAFIRSRARWRAGAAA